MKKYIIFAGFIFIVLMLAASLLLNFIYFNSFHKNLRSISDFEQQSAIDILNKTVNLEGYQVKVAKVYSPGNRSLVQIELIKDDSIRYYLIDLKEMKIRG